MHLGNIEDRMHTTPVSAESPVIRISRKKLRSLIQMVVKHVGETAQREKIRGMSRYLVKETLCDVFMSGHSAATDEIKNSSFTILRNLISEMIHCGVMNDTPNQSFNQWS